MKLAVDVARLAADLEALSRIGRDPEGGITRRALSPEDAAARRVVIERLCALGLDVRHDEVGNVRARWGSWDAPAVMTGSHLDTVPRGGHLDGPLGVVGAVEAVATLKAAGLSPRRPIEVVVFVGEEGSRFRRGTIGSAAISGHVKVSDIHALKDPDGIDYKTALATYGDAGAPISARLEPGQADSFVELHVEQGGVLEAESLKIGAVTAITGLVQRQVTFLGEANHAGATPMHLRRDALLTSAQWALKVELGAREVGGGAVGTVGKLEVFPGGKNIIPGRVEAICDLRAPTPELLSALDGFVVSSLHGIGEQRGVEIEQSLLQRVEPGPMAERPILAVERAAKDASLPSRRMTSGAIHDALHMAEICPATMIFVPSRGGRSHCPAEDTALEEMAGGVEVLARTLYALAND
jgi:allantoate deiminase